MTKKVAIQGFEGSFHQAAALHFFKNVQVIPCSTFREVIRVAENKNESNGGVMAIENSIAGTILPNYNLLQNSSLHIVGEVYLQIKQHLLTNINTELSDVKEVHSHPMALLQCIDFLDNHQWKLVETEDTALSAKHVHQTKSKHVAAVASKLAAELYNLKILAPNIHSQKKNFTRFLILETDRPSIDINHANKASVNFYTDHSKGSLAKVLTKIASCGINLSKLQSIPIAGGEWKYSFIADMEFEDVSLLEKALKKIKPLTEEVKVYGIYTKGKTYNE